MSRQLFKFWGGVHPPEHKAESNTQPVRAAPLPTKLVIPLRQHIGNPAKPVVEVGDHVLKGQMIGAADGYISAAVHASSSGTVTAIGPAVVPHVSGLPDDCITIETDGRDEWIVHAPIDYRAMEAADLGCGCATGASPASAARCFPARSSSTPAPPKPSPR